MNLLIVLPIFITSDEPSTIKTATFSMNLNRLNNKKVEELKTILNEFTEKHAIDILFLSLQESSIDSPIEINGFESVIYHSLSYTKIQIFIKIESESISNYKINAIFNGVSVSKRWSPIRKGSISYLLKLIPLNEESGHKELSINFISCHYTAQSENFFYRVRELNGSIDVLMSNDDDITFLAGDLNFRIDKDLDENIKKKYVGYNEKSFINEIINSSLFNMNEDNNYEKYFENQDQLTYIFSNKENFFNTNNQEKANTLKELEIKFRPTFKYYTKKQKINKYNFKRVPSWTDRILFAGNISCSNYSSINVDKSLFDHEPVYLLCELNK